MPNTKSMTYSYLFFMFVLMAPVIATAEKLYSPDKVVNSLAARVDKELQSRCNSRGKLPKKMELRTITDIERDGLWDIGLEKIRFDSMKFICTGDLRIMNVKRKRSNWVQVPSEKIEKFYKDELEENPRVAIPPEAPPAERGKTAPADPSLDE